MAKERLQEKKEVTQKVANSQGNYINEQDKNVSNEAIEVVNLVISVLEKLRAKNKDEAIKTIESAIGKLEVLIARDPSKELIPVDVKEQLIDFPGTIEDVVYARKVVADLIDEEELQKAREILAQLASELDIYVTSLPVAAYPVALKAIIPLIEQEKFDDAVQLIIDVVDTLVVEKIVLPLPILRAEQSIIRASELTKDSDDANKDELKELLAYAKEQLTLAQALGYGKVKEDYKDLLQEIEKIENILEGDDSTKGIFEELKDKLSIFMNSFNKIAKPTAIPKANN
jgi:hypothetical protein